MDGDEEGDQKEAAPPPKDSDLFPGECRANYHQC